MHHINTIARFLNQFSYSASRHFELLLFQVFLAGGSFRKLNARGTVTQDGISANLYFSDSSSGTWQMKAKMHRPRFQFALCLVDKYIYAIGGHTGKLLIEQVALTTVDL